MPQLPQQAADRVSAVLENHRANLMFQPGVMGVGVGLGRTDNEASIVIYVNKDAGTQPVLLDNIEGIPVTVILTDQFIARKGLLGHGSQKIRGPTAFFYLREGPSRLGYGPSLTTQQRHMRGSAHINE
jgi:hypothetical protein